MVGKLFHWFQHIIGSNTGDIVSWSDDKFVYVGFKCSGCGEIDQSSIDKIEFDSLNVDINKRESENHGK